MLERTEALNTRWSASFLHCIRSRRSHPIQYNLSILSSWGISTQDTARACKGGVTPPLLVYGMKSEVFVQKPGF